MDNNNNIDIVIENVRGLRKSFMDYLKSYDSLANPVYIWIPQLDNGVRVHYLNGLAQIKLINYLRAFYLSCHTIQLSKYVEHLANILIPEKSAIDYIKGIVASTLESQEIENKYGIWTYIHTAITEVYPFLDFEFVVSKFKTIPEYIAFKSGMVLPQQNMEDLSKEGKDINNKVEDLMRKAFPVARSLDEVKKLEETLKANVIGQDNAISKLIDSYKIIAAGLGQRSSLFFLGPTGVGKTKLAKTFGEFYSGNYYKIDCNEFANGHEHNKLVGAPPGYVGADQGNVLKGLAAKSSRWVFVFDEIEKAHPKFLDFIMILIEEGRVTDNQGNNLNFEDSIFIFTSNCGIHDLNLEGSILTFNKNDKKNYTASHEEITKSVNKHFKPEFRNRIDDFIYFNELSKENLKDICSLEVCDIPINLTQDVVEWIIKHSYNPIYGARELTRFIKKNITIAVADAILSGRIPEDGGDKFYGIIVDDKFVLVSKDGGSDDTEKPKRRKSKITEGIPTTETIRKDGRKTKRATKGF